MAQGPQHKLKEERLDNFERKIDALLKTEWKDRVTLDVSLIGISSEEFDELKIRYIQAGWKNVKYVSDQRDGDYLDFQAT